MNNLSDIFPNYFINNDTVHNYNTRNSKKIHKPYSRTNYRKHMLCNKGIDNWNELTPDIKNINSFSKYIDLKKQ